MLVDDVVRYASVDRYGPTITVIRVVENLTGPVLLGAIVLGAGKDDCVQGRMMVHELKLGDCEPLVDRVRPATAAVWSLVDAAIGAGKDRQGRGRVRRNDSIVGVDIATDVGGGPGVGNGVSDQLMEACPSEIHDVRS